jgi:hypothetical protein
MTYVPGGPDGFDLTVSLGVPPFEATIPIAEGVCQFTVQVEKKYIEINKITIGCFLGSSSTLTTTPSGTLLYSEGLKASLGPLCTLSAVATGIVIIKTTDCSQESGIIGKPAPGFPGVDSTHPATYQCVNNVLQVWGVVPDVPVPITYHATGPGGLSNVIPGPTLSTSGSNLCAANSRNSSSSAPGSAVGANPFGLPVLQTFLCPTGPGNGTVQACLAESSDTQPAGCSNFINFTYIVTAESIQHDLAALVTGGDVSQGIGRVFAMLLRAAANQRALGNCRGAATLYSLTLRLVHGLTGRGVSIAGAAVLSRDLQYLIAHCP